MTDWSNIKKLRYNIHKSFLRRTFKDQDWISKTGQKILRECRNLDHPITNTTFYNIRREIMADIPIEPIQKFVMSKVEIKALTQPKKVSIEEMVDNAIINLRTSDKMKRKI